MVNSRDETGRTPLQWAARGVHLDVVKLLIKNGADVNARDSYPFIAPDESYLLFISNRSGGESGGLDQFFDIYISFHQKDASWTPARKMENGINSDKLETTPVVSPDGKYLFFVSQRNGGVGEVYWVDAKIIKKLQVKS